VVLSVVADNLPALHLYEKHGFREYGRLPASFRDAGKDSAQVFMLRERTSADGTPGAGAVSSDHR